MVSEITFSIQSKKIRAKLAELEVKGGERVMTVKNILTEIEEFLFLYRSVRDSVKDPDYINKRSFQVAARKVFDVVIHLSDTMDQKEWANLFNDLSDALSSEFCQEKTKFQEEFTLYISKGRERYSDIYEVLILVVTGKYFCHPEVSFINYLKELVRLLKIHHSLLGVHHFDEKKYLINLMMEHAICENLDRIEDKAKDLYEKIK